jgi:transcriptional regulator with XRE-family HTH domain
MPTSSRSRRKADNERVPLDTKKVRDLRLAAGLTLAKAAKLAGLPGPQTWSDMEQGRRSNLTLRTLDRIAKALGVSARDLLLK